MLKMSENLKYGLKSLEVIEGVGNLQKIFNRELSGVSFVQINSRVAHVEIRMAGVMKCSIFTNYPNSPEPMGKNRQLRYWEPKSFHGIHSPWLTFFMICRWNISISFTPATNSKLTMYHVQLRSAKLPQSWNTNQVQDRVVLWKTRASHSSRGLVQITLEVERQSRAFPTHAKALSQGETLIPSQKSMSSRIDQ
jgi:hypothetical protein